MNLSVFLTLALFYAERHFCSSSMHSKIIFTVLFAFLLPLQVSVVEPKDEVMVSDPYSEQKGTKPFDTVQQAM